MPAAATLNDGRGDVPCEVPEITTIATSEGAYVRVQGLNERVHGLNERVHVEVVD
jgi:hypothetical protein